MLCNIPLNNVAHGSICFKHDNTQLEDADTDKNYH